MKIKIFTTSSNYQRLEDEINKFLKEVKNIGYILQSESRGNIPVSIFFD